jgi:hypothetical protein
VGTRIRRASRELFDILTGEKTKIMAAHIAKNNKNNKSPSRGLLINRGISEECEASGLSKIEAIYRY